MWPDTHRLRTVPSDDDPLRWRRPLTPLDVPAGSLVAGLSNGPDSAHNSKTIMLPELRALLAATPPDATLDEYREAAVERDVTSKATGATREKTLYYLRKLYTLDRRLPLFASLRELWPVDMAAQPILALLCALARDPGLRATAHAVLGLTPGDPTGPAELAAAIDAAQPGRYNASVLHHMGQNTGASWKQAGLLHGVQKKVRAHPEATVPAVAYALYLGHLEGRAGLALFDTLWTRVLDTPSATLQALAETAAHAGWLDLRNAGGMVQITFSHLDGLTGWGAA